jgi:hypothetical protein
MFFPSWPKMRTLLPLVVALLGLLSGALAQEGRISGKVISLVDKSDVVGATVLAYQISTEQVIRSSPTDSGGKFSIRDLAAGYYDLAIETPDGLFVADQIVNVPPAGKATINVGVVPDNAPILAQTGVRSYPGSADASAGMMQISERLTGSKFWKSPKGVAILSSAGGAALLALAISGKDDSTPITQTP